MSKQVREAAQRVIKHLGDSLNSGATVGDMYDVCRAWLAEHPDDDDTLVDVAWMDKCEKLFTNDADDGVVYFDRCEGIEICISGSDIVLMFCGVTLIESPTRGDVRRLARGLRVELGEKRDERPS